MLARAEDNAYFKMNVSDLEAMKALSLYSSDPKCKELLEGRNSLLNQLFKWICRRENYDEKAYLIQVVNVSLIVFALSTVIID